MLKPAAALRKDKTNAFASSMEHRHFATIAAILKSLHSVGGESTRTWVAEYFANELASTNPRFDRRRFLTACGAEDRI